MSKSNQGTQKLYNFYYTLMTQIVKNALAGKHNVEKDVAQLQKYLDSVQENNLGADLEGAMINAMGAISGLAGKYNDAQKYFELSYQFQKEKGNIEAAIVALVNYGTSKATEGDYLSAEETFVQAIDEMKQHGKLPTPQSIAQLASVYYKNKQYEKVHSLAEFVEQNRMDYFRSDSVQYIERMQFSQSISEIEELLVRIALRNKNHEEADNHLRAALENTLSEHLIRRASLTMVQAYVDQLFKDKVSVKPLVETAEEIINQTNSPTRIARFYFSESSEASDFGMPDIASKFAKRASSMFEVLDMRQDIIKAQKLASQIIQTN